MALPAMAAPSTGEFPAAWFWDIGGSATRFAPMLGKAPPALSVKDWRGPEQSLEKLTGKVVVVEFWATWCKPCRDSVPHMVKLVEERGKEGLVIIGIHDSKRGADSMAAFADSNKVNYSLCVDSGESEKVWKVSFWPTITVIDRSGKVRAVGLQPDYVDEVVDALLKEPAPGAAGQTEKKPDPKPDSKPAAPAKAAADTSGFTEGEPSRVAALKSLVGSQPIEITSPEWLNGSALTFADLKGKVVVLDFWATWCGPCIQSIPHNNELAAKYADKVIFLGVCHPRGGEKMAETVKSKGINYPVVRLTDESVLRKYQVNGFPDYYLIDRDGRVRIVDCANGRVEEAIEFLLK